MEKNLLIILVIGLPLLSGCTGDQTSDAYGQFEATETTVSAETGGKLLQFTPDEGMELEKDDQVGLIDTVRLALAKKELRARLSSVQSKITHIDAQVAVREERLSTAESDLKRVRGLIKDGAATPQKLDDAEGNVRALKKEVDALRTQKLSVRAEIDAIHAQIDQVNEQIRDARVINPVRGTVLTTFVEPYEYVRQGQALYRVANLDTLELRVYVSGAQLPHIALGQGVRVLVDKDENENQAFNGRISWIASEAEFTPKMIQTKEERVTQVYAVKIRVPNREGILKIGMPGEMNLGQ